MAIYETSALQGFASVCYSDHHRLLNKVLHLVLMGPNRLIAYSKSRGDPFARGSNEIVPWSIALQTSVSIGFWCIGVLAVTNQIWLRHKYPLFDEKINSSIRSLASSTTTFFWNVTRKGLEMVRKDDLTPTTHKGSCLCGKVKFDVKAPRTLYVEEVDENAPIAYPQTCLPVELFVLKHGRKTLQSFRNIYAYTFCSQCGMHILRVSEPDSPDLYLNIRCLQKGSFVVQPSLKCQRRKPSVTKEEAKACVEPILDTRQPATAVQSQPRNVMNVYEPQQPPDLINRLSPSNSSDDYGELVVAPQDDEPNFTVTAASSISSVEASATSMEYGDDLSTSRYEETAYRLRKALVLETKPNRTQATEAENSTMEAPAAAMMESFLAVEPSLAIRELKNDEEKTGSFPVRNDTALNQSYESSTDSVSDEETREQLRRFMSKHVQQQSFAK